MSFSQAIVFVAGMIVLAAYYWHRLPGNETEYGRRWLVKWMLRGLGLPVLAWVLLNAGRRPIVPALIPMFPPANAGRFGHLIFGVKYLAVQTGPALYVISSFWAALTLGWLVTVAVRRTKDPEAFKKSSQTWCVVMLPVVALLLVAYGPAVIGLASLLWVWPLAQFAVALKPVPTPPMYAGAIAKMKFGKYREAERAIIGELEKCETDFDGWLMLASLYAKQFHDLPEAERTIQELCGDPKATPSQIAIALNLLADWQLQLRGDPDAARHALDQIIQYLPGSHLARMAALRKHRLPATSAAWKEQQQPKTIQMPPLTDHLDHNDAPAAPRMNKADALALANECTEKLKRDPNDVEVREQLAITLAVQLGKIDLAIEQLNSLIDMPEQSQSKIAEWLALMAAWEIRRGTNLEAAQNFLKRLIHEHPNSVQAFAAQRRLSLLEAGARIVKATAATRPGLAADSGA